jgi:uncharacterized protein GlcG (DUF336 family)
MKDITMASSSLPLAVTLGLALPGILAASIAISTPGVAEPVISERQISVALAQDIATAAMEQCRKDGFKVAVTVVDRSGRLKVLLRDDGTGPQTIEASQRKAYTSAAFRVPSGTFAERVSHPAAAALIQLENVIALQGGVPVKVGDEVIGAVGVGGAPGGDKDEACANAGIQKVVDRLH